MKTKHDDDLKGVLESCILDFAGGAITGTPSGDSSQGHTRIFERSFYSINEWEIAPEAPLGMRPRWLALERLL